MRFEAAYALRWQRYRRRTMTARRVGGPKSHKAVIFDAQSREIFQNSKILLFPGILPISEEGVSEWHPGPYPIRNALIQILDVLYATTDGFEVPDESNGVDDEQDEY